MKINELIYDVYEAIKAFSDDSEIDQRYIIYLYNIKRAKYLRQDLNNYQKVVDNSITQTLCLKMKEVSINECSVDYSCGSLLRSTQPVPTPIELHSKVAITKVKPITKLGIPFNFITKDKAPYIENAPFNQAIYAFIDVDNYIYAYSKSPDYKLLECITVTGVFEDPLSLQNYNNCCDCGDEPIVCFDEATTTYPLQPHYIDLIRDEIIRDILRTKQIPEDKINDAESS
jgi:hypothetical protein